jgi:hypothetical protein
MVEIRSVQNFWMFSQQEKIHNFFLRSLCSGNNPPSKAKLGLEAVWVRLGQCKISGFFLNRKKSIIFSYGRFVLEL